MCSKTSSSGGGGGGGYVGGSGGGDSPYSKRHKRHRIPKRGPGVAELEKILREQQKRDDLDKPNIEFFSSHPQSNSYHHRSSIHSSSNSFPGNIPFLPERNHFRSQITTITKTLHGNDGRNAASGGFHGGHGDRSSIVSPEQTLLPLWTSCQSSNDVEGTKLASGFPSSGRLSNGSNQTFSSSLLLQKHCQHSPSMMNHYPNAAFSSSPNPPPAGLNQSVEPPSNQRSYHPSTSAWPEQEKMVGAKRTRAFLTDNPPGPLHQSQIPPFSPQIHKVAPSPSSANRTEFNLEHADTVSSDVKQASCIDLNSKKYITDYGTPDTNFLSFRSPAAHSPSTQMSQHGFNKFSGLPFQEHMESQERSGRGGLVHKKPFYSFLTSEEQEQNQVDTAFSLSNERGETRGDSIDLELRL